MYSKISSLLYVFLLVAMITNSNSQDGVFRIDSKFPQCANSLTDQIKEQCLKFNCARQTSLFECQAITCKEKFPNPTLEHKAFRLRCVKKICKTHPTHDACQGLKKCAKLKEQPLGRARFIVCISKLFPKDKENENLSTTSLPLMDM